MVQFHEILKIFNKIWVEFCEINLGITGEWIGGLAPDKVIVVSHCNLGLGQGGSNDSSTFGSGAMGAMAMHGSQVTGFGLKGLRFQFFWVHPVDW